MVWIQQLLLHKKQIRNISLEESKTYFPETVIQCEKQLLMNVFWQRTTDNQFVKTITFLRILGCNSQKGNFQGNHWVEIYFPANPSFTKKLWVYSLTCLRKHFLLAEDKLSFERSTFIVHFASQKLIRLKCIRSRLSFPFYQPKEGEQIYFSPTYCMIPSEKGNEMRKEKEKEREKEETQKITLRSQNQMKHVVEQLYTSYSRDLGFHTPTHEIVNLLHHDFCQLLNKF